jgi:hypothetical protein
MCDAEWSKLVQDLLCLAFTALVLLPSVFYYTREVGKSLHGQIMLLVEESELKVNHLIFFNGIVAIRSYKTTVTRLELRSFLI